MKEQLFKDLVTDITEEDDIHPAFVEKDWYIVKLIQALSDKEFNGFKPIFAGGTSLSKGYKLIERFSEDLDFKIVNAGSLSRDKRRPIRKQFIECIKQIDEFQIPDENIRVRNEGRICCLYINYPNKFELPSFLRSILQVELFFDNEDIPFEPRKIQSFISEYSNDDTETSINCIKPFYTGSDKFNALSWRIFNNGKKIDNTLLRHLHDMFALRSYLTDTKAFKERVLSNFENKDKSRLHNDDLSFKDVVRKTLSMLETDKAFRKGYESYVSTMCYAPDDKRIKFEEALDFYKSLCSIF